MKLYYHPVSTVSRPVLLLLDEARIDVELEVVDLFKGAHLQAPYAAINPSRQVPVLDDDGVVVSDSNAILVYLAKKAARTDWLPEDAQGAAAVQRWLSVAAGEVAYGPAAARLVTLFGAAYNPDAIVDQPYQFDFYDGGGLDMACVSFAQVDARGNVNVTRFAGRVEGSGGFIDITQNAKAVCFLGTFTGGKDGKIQKFVERVEQVSFSGAAAAARSKPVLYITERAVFGLTPRGVELREIAPGLDLERDVLAHMGFQPLMPSPPRSMDARLFSDAVMGLTPVPG